MSEYLPSVRPSSSNPPSVKSVKTLRPETRRRMPCSALGVEIRATPRSWVTFAVLAIGGLAAGALTLPTEGQPMAESARDTVGHRRSVPAPAAFARPGGGTEGPMAGGVMAPTWRALGPFGGQVDDVARSPIDSDLLLAATVRGVFRSVDGGDTWAPVQGPGSFDLFAVAFASDGTAYVGGFSGLWKSTDGGATFTQTPIPNFPLVQSIAIDPQNDSNLWVGLFNPGDGSGVIYRSTNAGASWNVVSPAVGNLNCDDLAVDPADSNHVVAVFGGNGGGVWVTTNGGTGWTNRSAGLPAVPVRSVAFAGSQILVGGGQLFGGQAMGLYGSINDGMTWTPRHDGTWPLLVVRDVAVDPGDSQIWLAATDGSGVHRTTDGGASWQLTLTGTDDLATLAVAFAPGSSTVVDLGTSSRGFSTSSDGGASFAPSNNGLTLLDVLAVAANPLDPQELAVAYSGVNDGGLYTSTDGGQAWFAEPVPATRWDGVEFDAQGTLYATSDGPTTVGPEGLYRREPGGSWTSLGPDQGTFFETDVSVIRFSPTDPDVILLAGRDSGVVGGEATIWRTLDRGSVWTKVWESATNTEGEIRDLERLADDPQVLVGVRWLASSNGGVVRSVDGGASWGESSTGLPAATQPSSLCAFADAPSTVLLGDYDFGATGGGIRRSTDGGQTWQAVGFQGAPVLDVACGVDGALYATSVFSHPAVNRSTDGGVTFEPFVDGLEGVSNMRFLDQSEGPNPRLLLGAFAGSYAASLEATIFADGFESGDLSAWSSSMP